LADAHSSTINTTGTIITRSTFTNVLLDCDSLLLSNANG